MPNIRILYRCDKFACGDKCPNDECYLTEDIRHAANFELDYADDRDEIFVEKAEEVEADKRPTKNGCFWNFIEDEESQNKPGV